MILVSTAPTECPWRERIPGEAIAGVLRGAWRQSPPPLDRDPAEVAALVPLLVETGAGALVWWRLRRSAARDGLALRPLRQAYRAQALAAATQEEFLKRAVRLMRWVDAEPILVKGWSAARLYPQTGLRPYGDVDLCVAPEHFQQATAVLQRAHVARTGCLELHEGVPDVTDRTWPQLLARSRLLTLGDTAIRVLGPEDQLRQLCLHFLRHHAGRPLWLCDIAALLEALPADFDWEYVFHGDSVHADWIACFIALAVELLGATLDDPAVAQRLSRVPRWLVQTVLWTWGLGAKRPPLGYFLRRPKELPGVLAYRWLDPIRTAYRTRRSPASSLVSIQLLALLSRPLELAVRTRRIIARHLPGARQREAQQPWSLHRQDTSRFL